MSNRIAFIDTRVSNYQSLIHRLPAGTEVALLNPAEDGLAQIAARLQGLVGLDAIDVFSHGAPGTITLGSAVLNNDSLANHAVFLAEIGGHLTNGGDILLYGCDVAAGEIGQAFIQQLAQLTGADVAASTDLTGLAALGGDWVLEAQTGAVETANLQPAYDGALGNYLGTNGNDVLTGTPLNDYMEGYSGSDTLNGGDGDDGIHDHKWFDDGIKDTNILNGGAGRDHFSFSGFVGDSALVAGGADSDTYYLDPNSTGLLVATDFEVGDGGDVLDIYPLLSSNPGYNWGDSIEGYLRIYQRGTGASTETWLQWDVDGTAGNSGWRDVIKLENGGVALNPALLSSGNFSTWQLPPISLHGSAPVVTNPPMQPLAAQPGQSFQFALPADTFSDPDADPLSYSATLDGAALAYDPVTSTFSGVAPPLYGKYSVELTATDASGNSTSTPLTFLIPYPAHLGTPFDDMLYGTSASDIMVGLEGSDQLFGDDGDDILAGDGTGSSLDYDTLTGGFGDDVLYAGDGGATLYGNEGNDLLVGGAVGYDWLAGGPGNDRILAGAGDDYISETNNSAGDVDVIDGGAGDDAISYASYGGSATVTGGAGADSFFLNPDSTGDFKITDFTVGLGGDTLDIVALVSYWINNYGYSGNPFDPSSGFLRLNQVNAQATWLEWNNGTDWVKAAELQGIRAKDLTVDNFTSLQPGDTLYFVSHSPVANALPVHHLAGVNLLFNYILPTGTFTDGDDDPLTYSAQLDDGAGNLSPLPSWLSFDANTQTFSGTPSVSDNTGTPLIIRITASDGTATADTIIDLRVVVAAGTSGNDNITGSVGNDYILGLDGNDNIYGFGGDDVLYGNGDGSMSGNWNAYDNIYGGDGNDTIYGGDNSYWYNSLQGDNGDDVVVGGNGDDIIDGGAGSDMLFGGSGNDELSDQAGDSDINIINGGVGNDHIRYSGSSGGSATVTGGAGNDIYWLAPWSGGNLVATDFQAGANGDVLQINDVLTSYASGYDGSANPFAAGYLRLFQDGADTLLQANYDPASNPPEYDWSWNTLIRLQNVSVDTLTQDNFGPQVNPTGSATNSVNFTGTYLDDTVFGGLGNDIIDGGGSQNYGKENLYGYAGDDTIIGNGNVSSSGYVQIYGGLGDDTLSAGYSYQASIQGDEGNDTIAGGAGDDYLDGGTGSDIISGNDGNDYISDWNDVAGDLTTMHGGDGNDTFTYGNSAGSAEITGGSGSDVYQLQSYSTGSLRSLDFTTGSGGDVLAVDGLLSASQWTETQGNPFAMGSYHYLQLVDDGMGGTALQWDRDGAANGYGWQTVIELTNVSWNNGNHGITIDNFAPKARPDGSSGGINLTGDSTGNTLYGSIGDDVIDGAGGYFDTIYGYGGNDTLYADRYGATTTYSWAGLYGGSGNDTLWAGSSTGSLSGEAGDDMLHGGSGRNYLYGGAGNDTIDAGAGDDVIQSWGGQASDHDIIDAGAGNDILYFYDASQVTATGGSGADSYYLSTYSGLVTITDFEGYMPGAGGSPASGDVLNIDSLLTSSYGYSSGNPFPTYLQWTAGPGYIELQWDRDGTGTSFGFQSVARLQGVQEIDLAPGNYAPTIDAITVRTITVTDGYVAGADIYFDADADGIADANEYSGQKTDASGHFQFTSTHTETIIAVGGTNIDTGLPNLMTLKAPNGATTVNPLTTLVQTYLETQPGATLAQATAAVHNALGLPSGIDVLTYDPLAPANASDPNALAVQKIIAQVVAVAVLSGQPGDVVNALTNGIANTLPGDTVDLTNVNDLNQILDGVVPPETLSETSNQIAGVNTLFAGATDLGNLSVLQGENLDTAPNAAPELSGEPVSLANGIEDQQYTISAVDLLSGWTDPNGNTLSVTGLTATHGALLDNHDGTWFFTPNADYNGPVVLSYQVTDGAASTGGSNSLTIMPVNDAPVNTVPGTQSVNSNTVLGINNISINDVDGNLTTTQLSADHGSVKVTLSGSASLSAGANDSATLTISGSQADINATLTSLKYQSNLNYAGGDTLTVISTDSAGVPLSDTDTVAITVSPVVVDNHAPTASDAQLAVNEDASLSGQLPGAVDTDGDTVTYALVVAATNGTAVVNGNGSYSYVPHDNFNGDDSFHYSVSDGKGGSNTYTVSIAVAPINDAPVLSINGNGSVNEGTIYTLALSAIDLETSDNALSYSIDWGDGSAAQSLTAAQLAALTGNVTHVYADDEDGPVNATSHTIRVTVDDGEGGSATQTHGVTVNNVAPDLTATGNATGMVGQLYTLALSNLIDPGTDTLLPNGISVDWGDGSVSSVSALGNVTHTYAGSGSMNIAVSLSDEDGSYANVAGLSVDIQPVPTQMVKIGDAPERQSGFGGQWAAAWTNPEISIAHKADVTNTAEAWSAVKLSGVSPQLLAGGDIFAGDLGVSGQSAATSTMRQEIDGKEGLRFNLGDETNALTLYLSRLFTQDDGSGYVECGRLRLLDAGGNVVGETLFHADNASGTKQVSLSSEVAFTSVELSAGVMNDGDFIFGGYANADGSFGSAVTTDAAGVKHGSDFLVDAVEFELPVLGVPINSGVFG